MVLGNGRLRRLALNGGYVTQGETLTLTLPLAVRGYADAQIDDYGHLRQRRRAYPWLPGTTLRLQARFSHPVGELVGTAGFGFWNAPFGDTAVPWPALPQATWFFYASPPSDLPLAHQGPGRGWFAATLDATPFRAWGLAPLSPFVLLLQQIPAIRRRLWPMIRRQVGMSFAPLPGEMTDWHTYELRWQPHNCQFWVDDQLVLFTPHSPRGPLGFVCWLDNQYLVANPQGRLAAGALPIPATQWLEIGDGFLSGTGGKI